MSPDSRDRHWGWRAWRVACAGLAVALAIPAAAHAQDGLKINEIFVSWSTEPASSWVEIHNSTNRAIAFEHLVITNAEGRGHFGIGPSVIEAGEFLVVGHLDAVDADIRQSGEQPGRGRNATHAFELRTHDGRILDTVLIGAPNLSGWRDDTGEVGTSFGPAIPINLSVGRFPDGHDTDRSGDDVIVLPYPSPGAPNGSIVPPCTHDDDARGVVLNEVYFGEHPGDRATAWIEIYNAGTATVDLSRWTVRTETTSESLVGTWLDPSIGPGEFLVIGGSAVPGRDATLIDGLSAGDRTTSAVRLMDCSGQAVDSLVFGAPNTQGIRDDTGEVATRFAPRPASGVSMARRRDGVDTDDSAADFVLEADPTPRAPNRVHTCAPGHLVLNEIRPGPTGEVGGEGWIELYNPSGDSVQIEGFVLDVDRERFDGGAPLPALEVPAHGYLVLGPAGSPYIDATLPFAIPFAGAQTVGLQLRDCAGTTLDTVLYGTPNTAALVDDSGAPGESLAPDPPPESSIARVPNGRDTDRSGADFRVEPQPTPGAENREPIYTLCDRAGFPPVVINEVSAWPFYEGQAWVELYNPGQSAWRLDGWSLEATTASGGPQTWSWPGPTRIEPGGFLVIAGETADVSDERVGLDLPDGTIASSIILRDCIGARVDTVLYGPPSPDQLEDDRGQQAAPFAEVQTPGAALARREDGRDTDRAGDWAETWTPTPGEPNDVPLDEEREGCECATGGEGVGWAFWGLAVVVLTRRRPAPCGAAPRPDRPLRCGCRSTTAGRRDRAPCRCDRRRTGPRPAGPRCSPPRRPGRRPPRRRARRA